MTDATKFECQGIGRGAVCGADATKRLTSYKWNPETQKVEETEVWICDRHLQEVYETFTDTGRHLVEYPPKK